MAKKEKIIGIDLGTSNSAAAVLIGGKSTIIPSAEGATQYGKAFPSYVAFTKDGQRLVGEPAVPRRADQVGVRHGENHTEAGQKPFSQSP